MQNIDAEQSQSYEQGLKSGSCTISQSTAFSILSYRPIQTSNLHTFNLTRNVIQFYLVTILLLHFKIVQNV